MLLLLTVLSLTPPTFAQAAESPAQADIDRAKQLFRNGATLYDEGRYEDAIVAWEEAYNLSKEPVLLFNIANAQERLGRYQDAYDTLNRYRAFAPESEREALERRLVNLEARLREQPAPVAPPPTQVEAPREGGQARALILPAALYGVGVAGLGVGTGFGLRALGAREEAAGLCAPTSVSAVCPSAASDAIALDRQSALLSDVGFAVGIVGVVGGTATMFLGRAESSGVSVAPTGNGFVVSTRF